MLTIILNGKPTGTQYPNIEQRFIDHHTGQGEQCIWYPYPLQRNEEDVVVDMLGNEVSFTEQEILEAQKEIRKWSIENMLRELDVKTMKFVDGDITATEYEPFKLEKAQLRAEYKTLE